MYTQTYSRPLNIPSIIQEIKICELSPIKSDSPKIFPYLEEYHKTKLRRASLDYAKNNGLLSILHRKSKKHKNIHFHSSTYRYSSLCYKPQNFIEKVRSEVEYDTLKTLKEKSRTGSDGNQKIVMRNDFSKLSVMSTCKQISVPVRKGSLPDYGEGFRKVELGKKLSFKFEDRVECKDASCNT